MPSAENSVPSRAAGGMPAPGANGGKADDNKLTVGLSAPSISLPKGGGAIRGIGEKFAANPVTGTGSMTVPIAVSPGRSGFGPQLSLAYDSGAGNGPFGFGWSLSLPAITRKTDKGLPQYLDGDESDVYILSGSEDLVPVLLPNGAREEDRTSAPGFAIHRYRPRIEGLFARIERWSDQTSGEVRWRSISRDNITSVYGKTSNSRIADPADAQRVFTWLICESYDDKGNAIVYEYESENEKNVDLALSNERNRERTANRYLKRIKYGNRVSRLVQPNLTSAEWLFHVVFDYDEAHYAEIALDPLRPAGEQHRHVLASASSDRDWAVRPDPFSLHRAGFEVRTYRRCRRVLMFHRFDELGTEPYLVRATEFDYSDLNYSQSIAIDDELSHKGSTRFASFIRSATQSGFIRVDGEPVQHRNGITFATYRKKSLPPVEFEYSRAAIQDDVRELDRDSLENLPMGLDGASYQWVDLNGEGVSGILTERAGAWYYKPNLGGGRFGPLETVETLPSVAALSGGHRLLDLAGDGQLDVVTLAGSTAGFFERTSDEGWDSFKSFKSMPNIAWDDPNLRFLDLTGDGHADVLITEHEAITWYASLAEDGFAAAQQARKSFDEEHGPRLVFADGTQSVYLADMCGDGLTALVRIRNGEVCYWANLGYGRFGAKITMDASPWFDNPDLFDQRHIRLADIDGSGTNDIIYLGRDGVRLYFNQSGNRFSVPRLLSQFPRVDSMSSAMTADLLGNGTACLVWSSPLPGDARKPLRYVDLMGGQKPRLLIGCVNNLGAETRVHYAPSTKFYLADKLAGKPWITRIPFPVHVVERVETFDYISRNRFTSRHAYHHGYFDGEEREFRGFGMVEQWDTEELAALTGDGQLPEATNIDAAFHVPPVHTKTWFHTGVYLSRDHVSDYFAGLRDATDKGEYYREPGLSDDQARGLLLPDTVLPLNLPVVDEREACRALKGSMLRQEVYALDGTPKEPHPYSVVELNFSVRVEQARVGNQHTVFFKYPREAITYHYERNPTDPRVQHALTLEVDLYGNVLKEMAIGYGRRQPDASLPTQADRDKQTRALITYTESRVTNAIDDPVIYPDAHRTPLPAETKTYELTGVVPENGSQRYGFDEWTRIRVALSLPTAEIPYEQIADNKSTKKRLIEHVRTLYRPDDFGSSLNNPTALLTVGAVQPLALAGESYKLAFTLGLLTQVFQRDGLPLLPDPANVLGAQGANGGGYLVSRQLKADGRFPGTDPDDHWWIPAGRAFLSPNGSDTPSQELAFGTQHFFLVWRLRDPFHTDAISTESFVSYDAYDILMVETRDPLDNRVTVGERRSNGVIDPTKPGNDYRVLKPWRVMDANRNRAQVAFDTLGMVVGTAVMGKPEESLGDSLDGFVADLTDTDLVDHVTNPLAAPQTILALATTRLVCDLFAYQRSGHAADRQPTAVYALARETHGSDLKPSQVSRIQHSISYSDGLGRGIQKKIQAKPGPLVSNGSLVQPRWTSSAWTIFNNKGKPVRHYEPFFSATHEYEFGVMVGVSSVLFYDPEARVIATLHPNNTFEKVLFDPWQQTTYDANDTCAPSNSQLGDPRTDLDIGGYVHEYFKTLSANPAQPWLTWHAQRIGGSKGAEEQNAAKRAAAHADTPTIAHFDALGRPFLTVARNRVVCSGHDLDGTEDALGIRVELDVEGNEREVRDERKLPVNHLPTGALVQRIVMRYAYDMVGNRINQLSMEAGARWMLNDVVGNLIRAWDSRGHNFSTSYDALRRPVEQYVFGTHSKSDPRTRNAPDPIGLLVDKIAYGEPRANAGPSERDRALRLNLRNRIYRHSDSAGVATNARLDVDGNPTEAFDFKGNLLHSTRRLASDYKAIPDWRLNPPLDAEAFEAGTRYDALNRPIQSVAPHSSLARTKRNVIQPVFNEANLLERVDVWLERAAEPAGLLDPAIASEAPSAVGVAAVDYNARGQRQRIDYKNGASTLYSYDPLTFRLTEILTRRRASAFPGDDARLPIVGWLGREVQNLHYTYDPVGNITHIQDVAQQSIYFRNKRVEPSNDYTYDSLYRLIQATGREQLGQTCAPTAHSYNDTGRVGLANADAAGRFAPNDGNAMGTYIERYVYDALGNFLKMQHERRDAPAPGWTRRYAYAEASLIEPGAESNRLSSTTAGNSPAEVYEHDAHGSIIRMPHLQEMRWDYKDQLRLTRRQRVDLDDTDGIVHEGEQTFYVYDAAGQRLRKVCQKAAGLIEERIYLGGFEIFRRHGGPIGASTTTIERETLHLMDDKQRFALVETRTLDAARDYQASRHLVRYEFTNHLGSASLELDEQAQIISYEEYSPYGSSTYQAVRSQTEAAKRYRYTGMERDEESGLYYHGARYYAPWLCRWVGADSAGIGDGLDLYAYVSCRPLRLTDPSGFAGGETDWSATGDAVRNVHSAEGVPNFSDTRAPIPRSTDFPSYRTARSYGNQQAADFRVSQGMSGRSVQAGHTAGVRHVVESGIGKAALDTAPLQQLSSSLKADPGLAAEVTDPATGETKVGTRHLLAQEGMIDDAVGRARPTGGALEPQGLLDAAHEVEWRSRGTGLDQREVAAKRLGGLVDEAAAIAKSPDVQKYRAAKSAGVGADAATLAEPNVGAVPTTRSGPTMRARLSSGGRVAGGVLGVVGVAVAAKEVIKSVRRGEYGRAAAVSGATALGFTAAAPVVLALGVISKYRSDPTIEADAFAAGDIVQQATGSVFAGALVSAGNAVGLSIYATGVDFAHSARSFFSDW